MTDGRLVMGLNPGSGLLFFFVSILLFAYSSEALVLKEKVLIGLNLHFFLSEEAFVQNKSLRDCCTPLKSPQTFYGLNGKTGKKTLL